MKQQQQPESVPAEIIQSAITNDDVMASYTEVQMNANNDVSVTRQLAQPESQESAAPENIEGLQNEQPEILIEQPLLNSQLSFGVQANARRTTVMVSQDGKK